MVVETVEKKPGSKVTKKFHGDASKVTVRGPGIKKAFMNRAQNLTIDVKDAGMIHVTHICFLCCNTVMDLTHLDFGKKSPIDSFTQSPWDNGFYTLILN